MTARKDPGPTFERLSVMLDALQASDDLSREMRAEISAVLHDMWCRCLARGRGRPIDDEQRYAAFRVYCLVAHHGALVKAAAISVAGPRATPSDAKTLESKYREMLRAGELPGDYLTVPDLLAADLDRLKGRDKRR